MPEDTSEIIKMDPEGVDVGEVMRSIDERIASRPDAPELKDETIEELERRGAGTSRSDFFADPLQELTLSIQFARSFAEVSSDYQIGSNRKVIGPLIVFVKKVVRKLMKTYIDAVFQQQREFNRQILSIIENLDGLILRDRARSHPGKVDRLAFAEKWGPDFDALAAQLAPVAAMFEGVEWVVELGSGRGMFLRAALDSGLEVLGVEEDAALAGGLPGARPASGLCRSPGLPGAGAPGLHTRRLRLGPGGAEHHQRTPLPPQPAGRPHGQGRPRASSSTIAPFHSTAAIRPSATPP